MRILIVSEHAGFELKEQLFDHLQSQGYEVAKAGAISSEAVDYPPIVEEASLRVVRGEFDLGIFICGTGIGMSVVAGKIPGTRTALCTNSYMGEMARVHNDANILCLGSRVIGVNVAFSIVDAFLAAKFAGNRHVRRLNLIDDIEQKYLKTTECKPL